MTKARLDEILRDCTFKDWRWKTFEKGDGLLLQVVFDTLEAGEQHCRKWYISSYAVRTEVVRTAWKAIQAAVLHEAEEHFMYKGIALFSPHIDPVAIAAVADLRETRA